MTTPVALANTRGFFSMLREEVAPSYVSHPEVMGVQLSEYLLEKSRVVEQHAGIVAKLRLTAQASAISMFSTTSLRTRTATSISWMMARSTGTMPFDARETEPSVIGGEFWDDNAAMYRQLKDSLNVVGFPEEVAWFGAGLREGARPVLPYPCHVYPSGQRGL
jgi:hypothetical protein